MYSVMNPDREKKEHIIKGDDFRSYMWATITILEINGFQTTTVNIIEFLFNCDFELEDNTKMKIASKFRRDPEFEFNEGEWKFKHFTGDLLPDETLMKYVEVIIYGNIDKKIIDSIFKKEHYESIKKSKELGIKSLSNLIQLDLLLNGPFSKYYGYRKITPDEFKRVMKIICNKEFK